MKRKKISETIENINPKYIDEATEYTGAVKTTSKKMWYKWVAVAACFAIAVVISIPFSNNSRPDNAGFFGNGDASLLELHRDDFSPEIDDSILSQFENNKEVKKAYLLCTNDWFLSENLLDFSQVVSTDVVYILPGGEHGEDTDTAYSLYSVNGENKIEWVGSSQLSNDVSLPFGFVGLTYEIINHSLAGIEYEDYIITYSQRLYTVFVWVRCKTEDIIITYPTRSDLLGIENGGIYKLDELQNTLKEAYTKATD